MLPTGNAVSSGGLVPLSKTEKAELKQLRASGPKARLIHVRYGDPPPYRMQPQREWAEVRISYEGAAPKQGAPPKAVAIARAIVVFHPKGDPSQHLVNGPPIGVKDLMNDMIRCGERAANDALPFVKRCESAMRFVDIGDQLVEIGGEHLAHNCYRATATQATLDAIDAVLRKVATATPEAPEPAAPKEVSPPRARPPRPKRPPKPAAPSIAPTPETLEARRQREAKHEQHEAAQRAAEKAAEAAHKQAMAERRAARAAEKAAAGARKR